MRSTGDSALASFLQVKCSTRTDKAVILFSIQMEKNFEIQAIQLITYHDRGYKMEPRRANGVVSSSFLFATVSKKSSPSM